MLYLIEKHSSKEESIDDYSLKILKDADALDEIGAMSIFMASNWIDRSSPYFFNLLLHRLEREEINYCKKTLEILNTESAKQILLNKIKFISLFANQLKDELYGTEIFGQVNIQDYFDYVP